MGYQESIIICKNKEDLSKALDILYNIPDREEFIDIYAIGKFKDDFDRSYFVYIGGERHPYQSRNLIPRSIGTLIFLEYIFIEYWDLFDNLKYTQRFNVLENDMIIYKDIRDYNRENIVIEALEKDYD